MDFVASGPSLEIIYGITGRIALALAAVHDLVDARNTGKAHRRSLGARRAIGFAPFRLLKHPIHRIAREVHKASVAKGHGKLQLIRFDARPTEGCPKHLDGDHETLDLTASEAGWRKLSSSLIRCRRVHKDNRIR